MAEAERQDRRGRVRRRAAAVAGAVAIHAVLFLLAFASASGELVSVAGAAGGQTGPVFEVSLVRLSNAGTPQTDAGAALAALATRPHAGGLGAPIPVQDRRTDDAFSALERQLRAAQPAMPKDVRVAQLERQESGAPHPSPAAPSRSLEPSNGRDAAASGESAAQASTGALWGAIEPCWRNLGIRGRVPVVLEVALDASGGLRTPPRVIRSNTAPIDEPRLQAEAGALAAIAACAPQGNPMFGGRTYRLEFPAAP